MLCMCLTCKYLRNLLLNNISNMILHKFTFKRSIENLKSNKHIKDNDFIYLREMHTLDMSRCNQEAITDEAFENLRGIHTLNISHCNQNTITDRDLRT